MIGDHAVELVDDICLPLRIVDRLVVRRCEDRDDVAGPVAAVDLVTQD